MKKVVHAEISGIKCDTHGCGWRDDTARLKDYAWWLDRPCPKCGGNLLTEKDHKAAKRVMFWIGVLNFLFGWLGSTREEVLEGRHYRMQGEFRHRE